MRVAVFLEHINLTPLNKNTVQAFIFNIEDDVITGVGKEIIVINNPDYLCLWITSKKIEELYSFELDETTKKQLRQIRITPKPLKGLKDNPLFSMLIS